MFFLLWFYFKSLESLKDLKALKEQQKKTMQPSMYDNEDVDADDGQFTATAPSLINRSNGGGGNNGYGNPNTLLYFNSTWNVHGLFNFLLDFQRNVMNQDVPQIICEKPFLGASLSTANVKNYDLELLFSSL